MTPSSGHMTRSGLETRTSRTVPSGVGTCRIFALLAMGLSVAAGLFAPRSPRIHPGGNRPWIDHRKGGIWSRQEVADLSVCTVHERYVRAIHLSRLHWCDAVPRLAGGAQYPRSLGELRPPA